MKHLVIGGDGLIGKALASILCYQGKDVIRTSRRQNSLATGAVWLDLANVPDNWRPQEICEVTYFCAGVSRYQTCRENPDASRRVNVVNTLKIATRLVEAGTFLIYLSTNAVFDGNAPYRRTSDPVAPKTEYGRQKVEAECQLLKLGRLVSVLRLTKVFPERPPLLMNWISSLQRHEAIHPFYDLTCAPLPLEEVVKALIALGEEKRAGIWHLSGDRDVSYADLVGHLASSLGLDLNLVQPCSVRDSHHYAEHVPTYTSLDCSLLEGELGLPAPNVWQTLKSLVE